MTSYAKEPKPMLSTHDLVALLFWLCLLQSLIIFGLVAWMLL